MIINKSADRDIAVLSSFASISLKPLSYAMKLALIAACTSAISTVQAAEPEQNSLENNTLPVISLKASKKSKEALVAKKATSATKTDTPLIETAQAISVVTAAEMEQRGVQNINQAVSYTAGVQTESLGMDSRVDDISIRGFDASSWSSNRYLDGSRIPSSTMWTVTQYDPFGLESVEVVKGPSAVLYGQVAPGGLINHTSKKPDANITRQVGVQLASHNQLRGDFDIGGALDSDNKVLYRLTGLARDGDSEQRETPSGRYFIAPALSVQLAEQSKITLLSQYMKDFGGSTFLFKPQKNTETPAIYNNPLFANRPELLIDRGVFIGEPKWNSFDREQYAIGYLFEHAFNDAVQIKQNARYFNTDTLYRAVMTFGYVQGDGNQNRRAVQGKGELEGFNIDTQLKLKLDTGAVEHSILVGADYLQSDETMRRDLVDMASSVVKPINIFDPNYSGIKGWASKLTPHVYTDVENEQLGFYIQDQMKWDKLIVNLGLRHDRVDNLLTNVRTNTDSPTKNNATTYKASVLYKFDNGIAPYISYSESFEPIVVTNERVIGGTRVDEVLNKPQTGQQYELGVKYQPDFMDGFITLSAFDLRQQNLTMLNQSDKHCGVATVPDPKDVNELVLVSAEEPCNSQTGETRTRGIELEGKLQLTQDVDIISGLSWLDTEILEDTKNKGKELGGRPDKMAALFVNYAPKGGVLTGLGVGAGVRYVGQAWADDANTITYDAYTLFDASVRYDLGQVGVKGAQVSLSATNLSNKVFVVNNDYGSGRNVVGRLSYKW